MTNHAPAGNDGRGPAEMIGERAGDGGRDGAAEPTLATAVGAGLGGDDVEGSVVIRAEGLDDVGIGGGGVVPERPEVQTATTQITTIAAMSRAIPGYLPWNAAT